MFVSVGAFAFVLLAYFKYQKDANERRRAQTRSPRRRRTRTKKDTHAGAPAGSDTFNWNYYLSCAYAFAVGGVLYLAFFGVTTGDPLAGVAAQDSFGLNSISNLLNPRHLVAYIFSDNTSWFGAMDSLFNKAFVVAAMLCSVIFVVYREWGLLCFFLPLIYGQAAIGIGVSFPRFALVAIPFLALAIAKNIKPSWLVYVICTAMFALQLYLLNNFSLNFWVA